MAHDIVSLVPIFCEAFLGLSTFEEGGIAYEDSIERKNLDYSIESLHALDKYLDVLHKNNEELKDQTYTNTVLAAGCYLGETQTLNRPGQTIMITSQNIQS